MSTATKKTSEEKQAPPQVENPNLRIWSAVCTTDPDQTKSVRLGGRHFTAVDAYSRILKATEVWGPVTRGWGWHEPRFEYLGNAPSTAVLCHLRLWFDGDPEKILYIVGSAPLWLKDNLDDEALKKALTDSITKGLSYLGFSADVFLGLFDDNKYVQSLRDAKAGERVADVQGPPAQPLPQPSQSAQSTAPAAPADDAGIRQVAMAEVNKAMKACGVSAAELKAFCGNRRASQLATDELVALPGRIAEQWGKEAPAAPAAPDIGDPTLVSEQPLVQSYRQIQAYCAELNKTQDDLDEFVKVEYGVEGVDKLDAAQAHKLALQLFWMSAAKGS